jgi:hypothetical protein
MAASFVWTLVSIAAAFGPHPRPSPLDVKTVPLVFDAAGSAKMVSIAAAIEKFAHTNFAQVRHAPHFTLCFSAGLAVCLSSAATCQIIIF